MTDRDPSGGAMTGATGDLTPAEIQREFVPGEQREVTDPEQQADVTRGQGQSEAPHGDRDPRAGGDEVTSHEAHF